MDFKTFFEMVNRYNCDDEKLKYEKKLWLHMRRSYEQDKGRYWADSKLYSVIENYQGPREGKSTKVIPAMTYGAETWTNDWTATEEKLITAQREVERQIL